MEIKKEAHRSSFLNLFDILDSRKKETNLSKVLAYIISKDAEAFKALLDLLGIKISQNAKTCLTSAHIGIETPTKNKKGRTDIEISFTDAGQRYFIIIECKVSSGKATRNQYKLYKGEYNECGSKDKKFFVFLSHQNGINLIGDSDIKVIDLNWRELINRLARSKPKNGSDLDEFLKYYERRYGMANQREILVQDISNSSDIKRYENYVYCRSKVHGAPLYFAPYRTRKGRATGKEGINTISKILGIITASDVNWEMVEETCRSIAHNAYPKEESKKHREKLLEKWETAVNTLRSNSPDRTYYFLDEPIQLTAALRKDGTSKKGMSKNWIAGMVPPNRCVTFSEFLKRYGKAMASAENSDS